MDIDKFMTEFMTGLIIIGIAILLAYFISIYTISSFSAEKLCEEKGMIYLKLDHQSFFDMFDNVFCYNINEQKVYYFARD